MSHDEHTLSHDELAQPSSLPPRLGSDTGGELTSDLFHSLVEIGMSINTNTRSPCVLLVLISLW